MFGARRSQTPKNDTIHTTVGFTLIELMIVILVIGILAVVGMANFQSMREKTKYASCISNQKHVCEAAVIYSMDNNIGTTSINVSDLWGAALIT
ncbi:MAG: type II secretion system protein [Candidatus Latescibacterota bacterium]|nr:MAG: type II secretion system protein [Candidatus Latescibacterota bacterium]